MTHYQTINMSILADPVMTGFGITWHSLCAIMKDGRTAHAIVEHMIAKKFGQELKQREGGARYFLKAGERCIVKSLTKEVDLAQSKVRGQWRAEHRNPQVLRDHCKEYPWVIIFDASAMPNIRCRLVAASDLLAKRPSGRLTRPFLTKELNL